MNELGHDQIDILKMDIEGAEYEVVEDIRKSEIRPRQILIEFHHRFPGVGIAKTREAIKRIKSMGYYLFSVSPNNKEYGFIRGSGWNSLLVVRDREWFCMQLGSFGKRQKQVQRNK